MTSTVSLVKSGKSYAGVMAGLKLFEKEIKNKIQKHPQIVIKINFVDSRVELATTPVESVRAFIDFIRPFYKGNIVIAEEASFGGTEKGFKKYGFDQLVEVVDTGKGEVFKIKAAGVSLPIAKIYTPPNFVVSICRAKTHDSVVVTLALKNLLVGAIKHGFLKNRFRIHLGGKINQVLAGIAKEVYPDLAIIDGTIGMEGNGPIAGTPIKSGWVAVSSDALAADSLATYLMGFDIGDVGYLNLIREMRRGALYPKDKIMILGEKPESLRKKYKPHDTFEKQRWKKGIRG